MFKLLKLPPETTFSLSEKKDLERAQKPWELIPAGHKIEKPYPLLKKLVNMPFRFSPIGILALIRVFFFFWPAPSSLVDNF